MNDFAGIDIGRKSSIDPTSGIDVKRYTLYEVQNRKSLEKFTALRTRPTNNKKAIFRPTRKVLNGNIVRIVQTSVTGEGEFALVQLVATSGQNLLESEDENGQPETKLNSGWLPQDFLSLFVDRLSAKYGVRFQAAHNCQLCEKPFSIIRPMRNCRFCGKAVCDACSPKRAPTTKSKNLKRQCVECEKNPAPTQSVRGRSESVLLPTPRPRDMDEEQWRTKREQDLLAHALKVRQERLEALKVAYAERIERARNLIDTTNQTIADEKKTFDETLEAKEKEAEDLINEMEEKDEQTANLHEQRDFETQRVRYNEDLAEHMHAEDLERQKRISIQRSLAMATQGASVVKYAMKDRKPQERWLSLAPDHRSIGWASAPGKMLANKLSVDDIIEVRFGSESPELVALAQSQFLKAWTCVQVCTQKRGYEFSFRSINHALHFVHAMRSLLGSQFHISRLRWARVRMRLVDMAAFKQITAFEALKNVIDASRSAVASAASAAADAAGADADKPAEEVEEAEEFVL